MKILQAVILSIIFTYILDIEEIDTQLPVEDAEEEAELSAYIDNTVALEEDDSNIEGK